MTDLPFPSSVLRVLVVDDDAPTRAQLATGLARAGFAVAGAGDPDEALALAGVTPPDVAIVDLEMPGIGGLGLIRALKQRFADAVHVVVLTGHDREPMRVDTFALGADDFVTKPTSLAELRGRISAAGRKLHAFVQVRLEKEAAERRLVYGQEATALLAHDLNNGLAVALGNLSYLIGAVRGDAEAVEALAATLRSVRRMAGLVANFVDIARFEDAAVEPVLAAANVRELLDSVLAVHAVSLARGLHCEIDCAPALTATFDVGLVERSLHNLFGNASRYCRADGTITLRARALAPHGVELVVANAGPAIPAELEPRLFGKYARGTGGKRGMGLYFCRLVAEAHGGSLRYLPTPDGPSFHLHLPGPA